MLILLKLVGQVWHMVNTQTELLSLFLLLLTDEFVLFITVHPVGQIHFLYVYSFSVYIPLTFLLSLLYNPRAFPNFKQVMKRKFIDAEMADLIFLVFLRVNLFFPLCYRWYARLQLCMGQLF